MIVLHNTYINSSTHSHFKVKLSIPQLRQVTTFLQKLTETQQIIPVERSFMKLVNL